MKKTNAMTALLALLLISGNTASAVAETVPVEKYKETIRVACIGDSITFGAGIRDRAKNNYPLQLGKMLGDKWEVRNFGVNGATMLKKGDKPYWKQNAWKAALAFKPHVVVIKLGTNDTKPQNWKFKDQYVADYKDMIKTLSSQDPKPMIWICKPVPAYPERWGIRDTVIKNEVLPLAAQVAKETDVQAIDLYTPLSGKPELFPDKIHPNAAGAGMIAGEVCKALTGKAPKATPAGKSPGKKGEKTPATAP